MTSAFSRIRWVPAAMIALGTALAATAAAPDAAAQHYGGYYEPGGAGYYHGPRDFREEGWWREPRVYRHRYGGRCHYHGYRGYGRHHHRRVGCHPHHPHPGVIYVY